MYVEEKTCGSVMFIRENGVKKYLLIKNDSGHIGFPKGHIEENETEKETAEREVFEETGLKIEVDVNTRQYYSYVRDNRILKHCVYFCNEFFTHDIKLQENEVFGSWLVPYAEALQLLNYPQDRVVLTKADKMYD
ncbi:MAG: NUDIX domain-containing protein [Oscillospiraceae bacterium]|nr:NUDIX domain-containing protein [Oscillospiraceae bacterium]